MKNNSYEGKRIWVTGASRGIGSSIAETLLSKDTFVVLTAREEKSFGENLKSLKSNPKALITECDIGSSEDIKETWDKIIKWCGGIDILINNAGVVFFKELKNTSIEEFEMMCNTNFRGTFLCTKAVIPGMIENKKGIIVNINSVSAIRTFTKNSIYAATKAAILAMSRSLREEVRSEGIKVIDIFPGATSTGIWRKKVIKEFGWRMMNPSDVASVVIDTIEMCLNERLMVEEIMLTPQLGNL
jgi:short-subunit dehydrogenase